MKKKPILCWNIGYIPDFNDEKTKDTYGSEIALVYLSEIFAKKYRVIIFGNCLYNEIIKDGIEYLNTNKFEEFQKNNEIDVLILSRYILPFLEFELKANSIFILIQDVYLLPYYKGVAMSDKGKGLLKNVINKIDGIITLTNWNKKTFVDEYEIDPNKVFIIGNAIEPSKFTGKNIEKQKNKFIWTSHGGRGAHKLLEYFHEIKKRLPDAELYIYRDETAFSPEVLDEMSRFDYFHYGGKIHNDKIIEEYLSSEMWFYPTDFTETYCMSAVEAQMSGCVCVTTHLAGLIETVANRGVLIKDPVYSEEYKENIISEVVNILNNEELKKEYSEAGQKWAKTQSWKNISKQWFNLFEFIKKKKDVE